MRCHSLIAPSAFEPFQQGSGRRRTGGKMPYVLYGAAQSTLLQPALYTLFDFSRNESFQGSKRI
ncbi:MAG TPA: hypothetical protein VKB05_21030 [Pyrinomonadaceae bacterium]|nr:hypothetical protein [Pyrinomonadaceae bacterium]